MAKERSIFIISSGEARELFDVLRTYRKERQRRILRQLLNDEDE